MASRPLRITRTEEQGIIWQDNLAQSYHQRLYSRVANSDEIACHGCAAPLSRIALDECWYYVSAVARYYCRECFREARPLLCKELQRKKNAEQARKMPRPMAVVMRQIEEHPDFAKLTPLVRAEYDGAISLLAQGCHVGEQNSHVRRLWLTLCT